jgi:hypothetical protein
VVAGRHDGTVKGVSYYKAKPGYGVFVRLESVKKYWKETSTPSKKASPKKSRKKDGDLTETVPAQFKPKCTSCHQPINHRGVAFAGSQYHIDCFKCAKVGLV